VTAATHQARLAAIRRQTAVAVTNLWDRLDRYDADVAAPFAARVVPLVAAGQLLAARTTNAYVARLAQIRPVPLTAAAVTGPAARRGVDPLDEYQRPFGAVWSALDDDVEPMEAAGRGRSRLTLLAVTDVWLATRTATEIIDRATDKIIGWVHVADAGACELCSSANGMPLAEAADFAGHPNCGCTSEPTFAESADSTAADPDGVEIEEHGELGRVLVAPTRTSSEEDSIGRSRALPAGTDTTSTAVQDVLNLAGPAGNR
jgi:hypothetical protein